MAKLTDLTDLNPQPKVWPECPTCCTAFVLRRGMVFNAKLTTMTMGWVWQRDCKHKVPPRTGQEPRRQRKPRASRAKRSSLSPAEKQRRDGTWKGHHDR